MSELHGLLGEVQQVLRQRQRVRRWEWMLRVASIVLSTLVALGLLDWFTRLHVLARLSCTLLLLPLVCIGSVRYLRPRWSVVERPVQLACSATRHPRLVGDVIAAMQFEASSAADEGHESHELKQAVIRDVARRVDQIEVRRQRLRLSSPAWYAAGVTLCWVFLGLAWAPYSWAYFQRMLGWPAYYPTRTNIAEVSFDGRSSPVIRHRPVASWVVRGEPVRLIVTCGGDLPDSATMELQSSPNELVRIELSKQETQLADVASAPRQFYTAQLPPLTRSTTFRVQAGDAETHWAQLDVRDRPQVKLTFRVTPPTYAGKESRTTHEPQLKILAGSTVQMSLTADQPLRKVTTQLTSLERGRLIEWLRTDESTNQWQFPTGVPPLDTVLDNQQLLVQIESSAGVELAAPLRVELELDADRSPEIEMGVEYDLVIPHAQPIVAFRARDDFGIQSVRLQIEFVGRRIQPIDRELILYERVTEMLQADVAGQFVWELANWNVSVGDRIRCTPLVTDYRHPLPGQTVSGAQFELRIGSENEVLAEVMRGDAQSQQLLDELIRVYTNSEESNRPASTDESPRDN